MKKTKITNGAFNFLNKHCKNCGRLIKYGHLFCNIDCGETYFKKLQEKKAKTYISEKQQAKRRIYGLSDILDKKHLERMIKITENNIDYYFKN